MKTKGMAHQIVGLAKMAVDDEYALLCDMGTGKSWMILADAESRYMDGTLDGLLIIAPKGVHTNFIRREIPTHLSVPATTAYWLSGASKRHLRTIERLYSPDALAMTMRIFAINIDALNHDSGFSAAKRFLASGRMAAVVDESSRIKSPGSSRTKRVLALRDFAAVRRIASGLPITNSPADAFSQFEFLSPGKLGTTSHRAFVAEYSQLIPPGHHLMRHIIERTAHAKGRLIIPRLKKVAPRLSLATSVSLRGHDGIEASRAAVDFLTKHVCPHTPTMKGAAAILNRDTTTDGQWDAVKAAEVEFSAWLVKTDIDLDRLAAISLPQVVAKDENGERQWRNLDKLVALISPHAFRVSKKECLDLPEKIYTTRHFELTPAMRILYERVREELRLELIDETVTLDKLGSMIKLQQVTSGFAMVNGVVAQLAVIDNPRLELFMDAVEDLDGQFIVWARFREELRIIADCLADMGITTVEYHGGVSAADREVAVDSFQAGIARAFVGQSQAGGIGLTLTNAETVIYYSNDYNLDTRKQSEDRAHRIGTTKHVVYIDLVASETLDEDIVRALQSKHNLATYVMDNLKG